MGGDRTDFFVSYAGTDRAWAKWVAWQLIQAGYRVELDVWDWGVGTDAVTAMSDALERADRMIALFSASYFQRERYTTEEWSSILVHVPGASRERLVPIRVEDIPAAKVPPLLRRLVYCDVFGVAEEQAREALLAAVAGPQRPSCKPDFPGQPGPSAKPEFPGSVLGGPEDGVRAGVAAQVLPPDVSEAVAASSVFVEAGGSARGSRKFRSSDGRHRKTAVVAGAVAIVIAAAVLADFGGVLHDISRALTTSQAGAPGPAGAVADQIIYTARTANDAGITLPSIVQDDLRQAGLAHQSIELTQIGYTGNVANSYIDMTPRTGSSSQDPVLRVPSREAQAIDVKISGIETAVNSASTAAGGGRALYVGLTRIDFTGAPVTIISSGIDLADPDDFRSLKWKTPPGEVVAAVKKADDLPALHGPVTFVIVPTAGPQPQLAQAQKGYLKGLWTALLTAAGATSVMFIDADGTTDVSASPSAPTVSVPSQPVTPIAQIPAPNGAVTCTVPGSYFVLGSADLLDTAKIIRDLTPCITAALGAHATFALDGWTSYEGPLNADGKPEYNDPKNQMLSVKRAQAIANLLVNELGVPASDITRTTGHGNIDQPDPDPRSAANRVVVITYVVRDTAKS